MVLAGAFHFQWQVHCWMLQLWPGCIFVGIGHFDNSSNTDCLMKKFRASFATNYTKSDTRALSIIWLLDVGVSTTWSWGEWSQKVSIKSQVKWWLSFPALPDIVPQMNPLSFCILHSVFEESSKCPIPTNKHPGRSCSIPLSVAGELLNAS